MSSEDRETRGTNESLPSSTDEQKVYEWGQEGYIPDRDEQSEGDLPTLVLDVPVLNVDEINLEVSDLRAHVSLRAELADLVKINVGFRGPGSLKDQVRSGPRYLESGLGCRRQEPADT